MEYVVDAKTMKAIDHYTIEEIGIPSMVLMERAAYSVYQHIVNDNKCKKKVLVVCGMGNNGADGVAIARMLYLSGIHTDIFLLGNCQKMTPQIQQQLEIVKKLRVPINQTPSYNDYDIIVDAIFGVGLSKAVTGEYEQAIRQINESHSYIICVDIPSGVNASDGTIENVAVKADITVTFGYNKLGLMRYPGKEYAGKVFVEDVGFPSLAYEEVMRLNRDVKEFYTFHNDDMKRLLNRPQHSNKGTFGTVLVVAGSKGMSGACYFSAKAALKSGAGLVKILTVEENRTILQTLLPEAVVYTYDSTSMENESKQMVLINLIHSAKSIVIGPGLGMEPLAEKILHFILAHTKVPTVIDADGINLLSKWIDERVQKEELSNTKNDVKPLDSMKTRLRVLEQLVPKNVIITPHLKEFCGIVKEDIQKIYKKFIDTIDLCSYNKVLIYIIKDSETMVIHGKQRYINTSGNDALATGGSGDVLTGIISGFVAQGVSPYDAACLGVYVHGLTAQLYIQEHFSGSMIASDIIENIGDVIVGV